MHTSQSSKIVYVLDAPFSGSVQQLMKKPKIKLPQSGEMIGRLKTRSFRVGGYSVLATVIVVAIAVFANILVNALPAKYTQFDTTSSQLYSISEQTELVLSELEDDVTVYWIVQDGREDETLGTLLDRYAAMSSKLTVTKVDPDVQPTFVQKYADGTIYNNSLVVECGERNTYQTYTNTITAITTPPAPTSRASPERASSPAL